MGKHSDLVSMAAAAAALAVAVLLSPWTSRALGSLDFVAGTPAKLAPLPGRDSCLHSEASGCAAARTEGVVTAGKAFQ